jgi:HK97 family phage prohead protease
MRPEVERRVHGEPVEFRSSDGEPPRLVGYAALFNVESRNLGGMREIIRPGAFDRALREKHDVVARTNHRSESLLGRVSNGTLRLTVDERGLKYEVDLPNTTAGRDTLEYVKRRDISESSFAFMVDRSGQRMEARASDGLPLRELLDLDLVDVAPVGDQAAYPATQVSARVLELAQKENVPAAVPMSVNEARQRLGEL